MNNEAPECPTCKSSDKDIRNLGCNGSYGVLHDNCGSDPCPDTWHNPPAAPDERDKALAQQIVMSGNSRYFDPTLIDAVAAALATVRAEERESQREADAKIADSIRNESRTQTAKNTALMIALAIRNPFDAESARGKGGRVNG